MSTGRIPGVGDSKTNWLKPHQSFSVYKKLDHGGRVLLRRHIDGEICIGHPFDATEEPGPQRRLLKLLGNGVDSAIGQILNHENIVSIAGFFTEYQMQGTDPVERRLLVWDYCDAGSLRTLFDHPPFPRPKPHERREWLPESLCWHVILSMLRALSWLHEGCRVSGETSPAKRETELPLWITDQDWMPVLHRQILPENIFFQQPRGKETYGLCKLGNFSGCYVSGHVNNLSKGLAMTTKSGDAPLADVRKEAEEQDLSKIKKSKRPYTKASEFRALGAALYQMMTGQPLPDGETCPECPCRHMETPGDCEHGCTLGWLPEWETRKLEEAYSWDLVDFVIGTLLVPDHLRGMTAVNLLDVALLGYIGWRKDTPDGEMYIDLDEEMAERIHEAKEDKIDAVAEAKRPIVTKV